MLLDHVIFGFVFVHVRVSDQRERECERNLESVFENIPNYCNARERGLKIDPVLSIGPQGDRLGPLVLGPTIGPPN